MKTENCCSWPRMEEFRLEASDRLWKVGFLRRRKGLASDRGLLSAEEGPFLKEGLMYLAETELIIGREIRRRFLPGSDLSVEIILLLVGTKVGRSRAEFGFIVV